MMRSVDTNQRVYFDIDRYYESILVDILSYKIMFDSQLTEEY